jgi:phage tail-like protein
VTHDQSFESWANMVWKMGAASGAAMALKNFRNDVRIELFNEAGQLALAWEIFRCWPSEYTALADLDALSLEMTLSHKIGES